MIGFNELEVAALNSIFDETPELAPGLREQLAAAAVVERENSGAGFFTTISVSVDAPAVESPSVLGYDSHARLPGWKYGLGLVLFMKEGRMHMLEGFSWGGESTASFDLSTVTFEIYKEVMHRPD